MSKGFTLIELSIVLVIIALIMSALLTIGINKTEEARLDLTNERLDKIEDAIGAYVQRNLMLPCPAPGGDAIGAAGYGAADCTNNVIDLSGVPAADIIVGTIPVADLFLPDEYMFDGWGRRFTYAVEQRFTTEAGFLEPDISAIDNASCAGSAPLCKVGQLTVYVREDDSTTPPSRTTQAVVVLVSHGKNGHGAWLKNGGVNARHDASSTDLAELENAHDETDDTTFDNEFTQTAHTADFDDVVRFMERWRVVEAAGGIIDKEVCKIAYRTNEPYDRLATPKTGVVGCEDETDPGDFTKADPLCTDRQSQLASAILDLCFIANPAP